MDDSSSSQFVAPFFDVKNHPRSETPLSSSSSSRSDAMEDRSSPTCGITRQKSRRFFSHRKSDETGMACLFKRTPYNTMILHGFPCSSRCFRLNFADTGRYQEKIQRLERMVTIGDWTSNQLRSIHCWKNKKVEQIGMFFTTSRTEVSLRAPPLERSMGSCNDPEISTLMEIPLVIFLWKTIIQSTCCLKHILYKWYQHQENHRPAGWMISLSIKLTWKLWISTVIYSPSPPVN